MENRLPRRSLVEAILHPVAVLALVVAGCGDTDPVPHRKVGDGLTNRFSTGGFIVIRRKERARRCFPLAALREDEPFAAKRLLDGSEVLARAAIDHLVEPPVPLFHFIGRRVPRHGERAQPREQLCGACRRVANAEQLQQRTRTFVIEQPVNEQLNIHQ